MATSVHIQDEALRRRARVRAAGLGVSVGVWVEGLIRRELDGTSAPEPVASRKPSVAPSLPPRMAVPKPEAPQKPEPAAYVVEDDDILLEPDEPVVHAVRDRLLQSDRRLCTGSEFAGPLTKERSMK